MGCNCKASQYIRKTEERYGLKSEPKRGAKFKTTNKALLVWLIIIICLPFAVILPIIFLILRKNRKVKLFNTITIRV